MNQDFSTKLNSLPIDVQDALLSDYGRIKCFELMEKYKIISGIFADFNGVICKLYFKELKLVDLLDELKNKFFVSDDIARQLALDIAGIRLLVVKNYFASGEIEKYIMMLGGDPKKYDNDVSETLRTIEKAKNGEDPFEEDEEEKEREEVVEPVTPEKEKDNSLYVFGNSLASFLNDHDNPYLADFNYLLIEYLSDDPIFKRELESALFTNEEIMAGKNVIIDGKVLPPTISSWLKDFISKNGSGFFDDMVFSKYMAESSNVAKLDTVGKNKLRKLLKIYRNLKFFPDSLDGLPADKLEIIPIDHFGQEDEIKKPIEVSKPAPTRIVIKEPVYSPKPSVSQSTVSTEPVKSIPAVISPADELRQLSAAYPDGSIEKRLIEEEIKKMSVKND